MVTPLHLEKADARAATSTSAAESRTSCIVPLTQLLLSHRLPASPTAAADLARRVRRHVALNAQEEARVIHVDLR